MPFFIPPNCPGRAFLLLSAASPNPPVRAVNLPTHPRPAACLFAPNCTATEGNRPCLGHSSAIPSEWADPIFTITSRFTGSCAREPEVFRGGLLREVGKIPTCNALTFFRLRRLFETILSGRFCLLVSRTRLVKAQRSGREHPAEMAAGMAGWMPKISLNNAWKTRKKPWIVQPAQRLQYSFKVNAGHPKQLSGQSTAISLCFSLPSADRFPGHSAAFSRKNFAAAIHGALNFITSNCWNCVSLTRL